jgi:hypothetical protein
MRDIRKRLDEIESMTLTDADKQKLADKEYSKRKKLVTKFFKKARGLGASLSMWEKHKLW